MGSEHNASEIHQLDTLVPNGHPTRRNKAANSKMHKCLQNKAFITASVTMNIILIGVVIGLVSKTRELQSREPQSHEPRGVLCPSGWHQYERICLYFSTEERNWTSSRDFCLFHNASLATIENKEKDFVMRFKEKEPYWTGLTKHSGGPWKWQNGDNATLEVLGKGENCAYLSDEVEAKASISRCSTEHRWICTKPAM